MTINVVKPEVLYNEYNPENEEKDVVDPTEKRVRKRPRR